MKPIHLLLLAYFLMLSSLSGLLAQDVAYTYDANGNRENRFIILNKQSVVNDDTVSNQQADPKIYNETIGESDITIYPNPSGGMFKVRFDNIRDFSSGSLQLTTLSGAMVFQSQTLEPETIVDIRNEKNGAYILIITIGTEKKTWKVIKQ